MPSNVKYEKKGVIRDQPNFIFVLVTKFCNYGSLCTIRVFWTNRRSGVLYFLPSDVFTQCCAYFSVTKIIIK